MRLPKKHRKLSNSYAARQSSYQESRVARELGGYVTPNSGAGSVKGDVRVRDVARIECKSTESDKFVLRFSVIDKIKKEALADAEVPIVQIDFIQSFLSTKCFYVIEELYLKDSYEAKIINVNKTSVSLKVSELDEINKFIYNNKCYYIFTANKFLKQVANEL